MSDCIISDSDFSAGWMIWFRRLCSVGYRFCGGVFDVWMCFDDEDCEGGALDGGSPG